MLDALHQTLLTSSSRNCKETEKPQHPPLIAAQNFTPHK